MAWELLLYPLTATAAVVSGLAVVYYTYPGLIVQAFIRYYTYASGVQVKYVGDEKFVFCYGERGTKQPDKSSILLLHGYTSSKDQFLGLFKKLPDDLHVIAMDLPGHGNTSTPNAEDELSFPSLIELVNRFVCQVGFDETPFHLVGTSLGAVIAGLYAARYPQNVEKLTLVCPAMRTPVHSEFSREMEAAILMGSYTDGDIKCALLPRTPEEVQAMLDCCQYQKKPLGYQILRGVISMREPKFDFFARLLRTLAREENMTILEDQASKITVPTQLIWGKHDKVIDVSGADKLRDLLANCQHVSIIDRCGHSVMMDRPGAALKELLLFRGEYNSQSEEEH